MKIKSRWKVVLVTTAPENQYQQLSSLISAGKTSGRNLEERGYRRTGRWRVMRSPSTDGGTSSVVRGQRGGEEEVRWSQTGDDLVQLLQHVK